MSWRSDNNRSNIVWWYSDNNSIDIVEVKVSIVKYNRISYNSRFLIPLCILYPFFVCIPLRLIVMKKILGDGKEDKRPLQRLGGVTAINSSQVCVCICVPLEERESLFKRKKPLKTVSYGKRNTDTIHCVSVCMARPLDCFSYSFLFLFASALPLYTIYYYTLFLHNIKLLCNHTIIHKNLQKIYPVPWIAKCSRLEKLRRCRAWHRRHCHRHRQRQH